MTPSFQTEMMKTRGQWVIHLKLFKRNKLKAII